MRPTKPLSEAFRHEPHHKHLWQDQGKCVLCNEKPRDLICGRCEEPFCAACLKLHKSAHLREEYIERVARGLVQHGVTREEWAEAMALRATWEAEDAGKTAASEAIGEAE